nr:MAG TPA: hypothetical protein [Caudoviricetes sp.]
MHLLKRPNDLCYTVKLFYRSSLSTYIDYTDLRQYYLQRFRFCTN